MESENHSRNWNSKFKKNPTRVTFYGQRYQINGVKDWLAYQVEPLLESQNISKSQTGSKLQARRSKKNTKSSSQDQPPPAELHSMPTPGFGQSNATWFDNNRLAVDAPVRSRHEKD
ncbi:Uncharacterized protein Fot_37804 [Forsythia ovata]|uniref:Uncharacterized protein n=1 Tax=Forsythia ovata TaxID=205694 RepID=A0ABD1S2I7_9LAMI